jgi:methionyl-tRNA formyltransferase
MLIGADLVLKTVDLIANDKATTRIQEVPKGVKLNSAGKINKETCKIDWNQPLLKVQNLIRGLSPYPAAWTTIIEDDEEIAMKIFLSSAEKKEHRLHNGTIVFSKKELKVAVAGGFISLKEIQLAGKRRMNIKDVLNGLKLTEKAHMA